MFAQVAATAWSHTTNDRPTIFRNDGLQESWPMKAERNAELMRDYEAGTPVPELLSKYKISRSRLYQLVNPTAYEGQRARRKEKLDAK